MNKDKIVGILITCIFLLPFLLPFAVMLIALIINAAIEANDYARIADVEYTAVVVDEPEGEG